VIIGKSGGGLGNLKLTLDEKGEASSLTKLTGVTKFLRGKYKRLISFFLKGRGGGKLKKRGKLGGKSSRRV